MKKHLIYSTLLIAVMMFTGCRGGNERGTDDNIRIGNQFRNIVRVRISRFDLIVKER